VVDAAFALIPVVGEGAAWRWRQEGGVQPGAGSMPYTWGIDGVSGAKEWTQAYFAQFICPRGFAKKMARTAKGPVMVLSFAYNVIVGVTRGELDEIAFYLIDNNPNLSRYAQNPIHLMNIMHATYAYIERNRDYFIDALELRREFRHLFRYQYAATGRHQDGFIEKYTRPLSGMAGRTTYTLYAFDGSMLTNAMTTEISFGQQIDGLVSLRYYRFRNEQDQNAARAFEIISAGHVTRHNQMTRSGFRTHMQQALN